MLFPEWMHWGSIDNQSTNQILIWDCSLAIPTSPNLWIKRAKLTSSHQALQTQLCRAPHQPKHTSHGLRNQMIPSANELVLSVSFLRLERFLQTQPGLVDVWWSWKPAGLCWRGLKGLWWKELAWIRHWRAGSHFFVPALMTVHRTRLPFHLCVDTLPSALLPHAFLPLLEHLSSLTGTSQPGTEPCSGHARGSCDKTELHFMPCAGSRWIEQSLIRFLPIFHGREQESSSPPGTRCPSMQPREKWGPA